jgi:AcrR family transcriptional regulator
LSSSSCLVTECGEAVPARAARIEHPIFERLNHADETYTDERIIGKATLSGVPNVDERSPRRDATRNRNLLLTAAQQAFAEHGLDVALEDIARAAGVSRTTLYRHFTTREELATEVFECNVIMIERRAAEIQGQPHAAQRLFDLVLSMLAANRSVAHVVISVDLAWSKALAARTAAAFGPLVEQAQRDREMAPGVGLNDVMLSFAMAGGALNESTESSRDRRYERARCLLHRALFSTEPA